MIMANAFEEAMNHGFSRAELAHEIMEIRQRMFNLGCMECQHMRENSLVCACVISHPEKYDSCMFITKGGNVT